MVDDFWRNRGDEASIRNESTRRDGAEILLARIDERLRSLVPAFDTYTPTRRSIAASVIAQTQLGLITAWPDR